MAEVHGKALVPPFIVPNQVLQILKMCLLDTVGHLQQQQKATHKQQSICNSKPQRQICKEIVILNNNNN